MSTLNEITYNILMSVRPHLIDDEDLTIEKVQHDINLKRAKMLKTELSRNRNVDINYVQTLGCVEMELASPVDCCIDVDIDCKLLRSKLIIPNAIEANHKKLIMRVGPIIKTLPKFTFVPYDRFIHSGNGKYNKNDIFATLHDGRIYLKSNNDNVNLIQYIDVQGIFEDPREAARFINCEDHPCYTDDDNYPLNMWMEDYIKNELIDEYTRYTLRSTKDLTNDGKSGTTDQY